MMTPSRDRYCRRTRTSPATPRTAQSLAVRRRSRALRRIRHYRLRLEVSPSAVRRGEGVVTLATVTNRGAGTPDKRCASTAPAGGRERCLERVAQQRSHVPRRLGDLAQGWSSASWSLGTLTPGQAVTVSISNRCSAISVRSAPSAPSSSASKRLRLPRRTHCDCCSSIRDRYRRSADGCGGRGSRSRVARPGASTTRSRTAIVP